MYNGDATNFTETNQSYRTYDMTSYIRYDKNLRTISVNRSYYSSDPRRTTSVISYV